MNTAPPATLSIAGSDCSAGAGAQADLKTFQHFQVHGLTAITCVVSETPKVVEAVHPVPVSIIESQVALLLKSYPVAAIKTGMLYSKEVIECIAGCLQVHPNIPLVIDPVMVASSGSPLIEADAIQAYRQSLFPLAALITPNLDEARRLLGSSIESVEAMEEAAKRLAQETGSAILIKGGHLQGQDCVDVLIHDDQVTRYTHPRIPDADTHGTGCSLAAAIAACLAKGQALPQAVATATNYLAVALRSRYRYDYPEAIQALNQGTLPGAFEVV